MRWTIVAFGKLKDRPMRDGVAEYLTRLAPIRPIEVIELADERLPPDARPGDPRELAAMQREGERARAALRPGAVVIALTERGDTPDSPGLATKLAAFELDGRNELAFVIGGACGLDPAFIQAADWRLSLSRLTLPHQLARLVLVEQLYRAERIRRGEPYHR